MNRTLTLAIGLSLGASLARTATAQGRGGVSFDPVAAGFTNIVNRDFNTIATRGRDRGIGTLPDMTMGSEGWDDVEHNYGPSGSGRLVQTASEVRMHYPARSRGGTAGMLMQTRPFRGNYQMLFASLDLHFDDAYWVGSVGNKLVFFRTQDQRVAGRRYRSEPILGIYNNGRGALQLVLNFQGAEDGSRNFGWGPTGHIRAAGLGGALRKGGRYRIEVLLELNSAPGTGDGRARVWVRDLRADSAPELVIDRSDVRIMPRAGTGWRWHVLHVSPTLGSSNPAPFYLGYEQVRIWGR